MNKWVGFDMDECIGSLMPMYAFLKGIPYGSKAYTCMIHSLIISELTNQTWLFRPAYMFALSLLYKAFKDGKIAGAFIFSNNSSQELVDFAATFSNTWISVRFADTSSPAIFKLAVCRDSPLRSPGSLTKSFSEICRALKLAGLNPPIHKTDLLFFDDMTHVLTSEITNYVIVRPYFNLTPVSNIASALIPCIKHLDPESWDKIVRNAHELSALDKDRQYIHASPAFFEYDADRLPFFRGFMYFLHYDGGLKTNVLKSKKYHK